MECPMCYANSLIILTAVSPEAHLTGPTYILWCENCGTTTKSFLTGKNPKLFDTKVPKTGGVK
jgi:hypothetical protein